MSNSGLCPKGGAFGNLWSNGSGRDNVTEGKRVVKGADQPKSSDINELRGKVEELLTPGQVSYRSYRQSRNDMGIYLGSVFADGTLPSGHNPHRWTCSRAANARYTVTHNLGTLDYAVIATVYIHNDPARERMINVENKGINSVTLSIQDENGKDRYNFFDLMLIKF